MSRRKSADERRAEAEALHAQLTDQVAQLVQSDDWARFLRFAAAFHSYSLNNVLLILSQCPHASQVAGFRQWQARGRQVRKGERSIRIFGYSTKKITKEDENGEEVERKIPRFPVLSVFDVSQTDPIEGAEPDPTMPTVAPAPGEHDGDPDEIYAATVDYLRRSGWTVDREPAQAGGADGYTTTDGTKRVVVADHLEATHAATTILHEAAHVILHADDEPGEYITHRGVKETEAESVAYVAAGLLGLDTSAYSIVYVAHWTREQTDLIRQTASNVLTAVHTLAEALNSRADQDEDHTAA